MTVAVVVVIMVVVPAAVVVMAYTEVLSLRLYS
jgi:hypothetical protein